MLDERVSGTGQQEKLSSEAVIKYNGVACGLIPPYKMTIFADGSASAEDGRREIPQKRFLTQEQAEDLVFRLYAAMGNSNGEHFKIPHDAYCMTSFWVKYQGRESYQCIHLGEQEFPEYIKKMREELEEMWARAMGH